MKRKSETRQRQEENEVDKSTVEPQELIHPDQAPTPDYVTLSCHIGSVQQCSCVRLRAVA